MILYDLPKSFFWSKLFVRPLIGELFLLIMLIIKIVLGIKKIKKEGSKNDNIVKYLSYMLSILFILGFVFAFAQYFRFGACMPFDQDEPITYVGNVEEIQGIRQIIRFGKRPDGSYRRAFIVKIDRMTFLCLDANYLTIGDKIVIKYLPKSKIVLYCELIEYGQ